MDIERAKSTHRRLAHNRSSKRSHALRRELVALFLRESFPTFLRDIETTGERFPRREARSRALAFAKDHYKSCYGRNHRPRVTSAHKRCILDDPDHAIRRMHAALDAVPRAAAHAAHVQSPAPSAPQQHAEPEPEHDSDDDWEVWIELDDDSDG